jgi:hypothetical protein
MAAYKKGQNPYNGPYSPDFDESKVQGLSRDAYYPSRKPGVFTDSAGPTGRMLDNAIDLSGAIDKQPSGYFHAFDNDKSADFSKLKSDQAQGGFAGVAGRSTNKPKKGSSV